MFYKQYTRDDKIGGYSMQCQGKRSNIYLYNKYLIYYLDTTLNTLQCYHDVYINHRTFTSPFIYINMY